MRAGECPHPYQGLRAVHDEAALLRPLGADQWCRDR
jgi:hypothetical protein